MKFIHTLNTFFLLNDESIAEIKNKNAKVLFLHEMQYYRVVNKNVEEAVVAVKEMNVIDMHKRAGLGITGDIHYGHWRDKNFPSRTYFSSRKSYMGFQDMIVSKK